MTTGEFVTYTNLTFLSHINLSHLQNARRQFITDGNGKLTALVLSIEQLILLDEVDDESLDEFVGMLIAGPAIRLNAIILKVLQSRNGELGTLSDNLSTRVILHAL